MHKPCIAIRCSYLCLSIFVSAYCLGCTTQFPKYLRSIEPILTAEELKKAEQEVADFIAGPGKVLQATVCVEGQPCVDCRVMCVNVAYVCRE
jgi:hypothetical protein